MDLGSNTSYENSFMVENVQGNALPKEVEEGNVEYKLKLVNPPPERIEHLITQLKWRLAEGHGEMLYEIGVADNGKLIGLNPHDLEASLETLRTMGKRLSADVSIIRKREVSSVLGPDGASVPLVVAEVLVRKCLTDDQHFLEVRVAILGGADAGKSTLVGVLTHSEFDNGRGKSRLNLLRHRHEIETGRTSSISHQIVGFNPMGDLINYGSTNIGTWEQVCETASKVVTFLDTCGHPKYQRTTISGISGHSPDYACLILSGSAGGISEVPREHLGIAVGLTVPVFAVITKIDVASQEQLTGTVSSLLGLLKSPGVRRIPMVIQNEDDLVVAVSSLVSSSVTGENIDLLVKFLNLLPKPSREEGQKETGNVEFSIEEVYSVPSVGTVLGGIMSSGEITMSGTRSDPPRFFLGPDRGRFIPIRITSLQRQRCPVNRVSQGQATTIAISFLSSKVPETRDAKRYLEGYESPSSPRKGSSESEDSWEDDYDRGEDFLEERETSSPPTWFRIRKGQMVLSYMPSFEEGLASSPQSLPIPFPFSAQGKPSAVTADMPASTKSTSSTAPDSTGSSSPAIAKVVGLPVAITRLGASSITLEFEADLHVLHVTAPIAVGSQGVTYCGAVRQGCRIISICDEEGRWACLAPSTPTAPLSPRLVGQVPDSPLLPGKSPKISSPNRKTKTSSSLWGSLPERVDWTISESLQSSPNRRKSATANPPSPLVNSLVLNAKADKSPKPPNQSARVAISKASSDEDVFDGTLFLLSSPPRSKDGSRCGSGSGGSDSENPDQEDASSSPLEAKLVSSPVRPHESLLGQKVRAYTENKIDNDEGLLWGPSESEIRGNEKAHMRREMARNQPKTFSKAKKAVPAAPVAQPKMEISSEAENDDDCLWGLSARETSHHKPGKSNAGLKGGEQAWVAKEGQSLQPIENADDISKRKSSRERRHAQKQAKALQANEASPNPHGNRVTKTAAAPKKGASSAKPKVVSLYKDSDDEEEDSDFDLPSQKRSEPIPISPEKQRICAIPKAQIDSGDSTPTLSPRRQADTRDNSSNLLSISPLSLEPSRSFGLRTSRDTSSSISTLDFPSACFQGNHPTRIGAESEWVSEERVAVKARSNAHVSSPRTSTATLVSATNSISAPTSPMIVPSGTTITHASSPSTLLTSSNVISALAETSSPQSSPFTSPQMSRGRVRDVDSKDRIHASTSSPIRQALQLKKSPSISVSAVKSKPTEEGSYVQPLKGTRSPVSPSRRRSRTPSVIFGVGNDIVIGVGYASTESSMETTGLAGLKDCTLADSSASQQQQPQHIVLATGSRARLRLRFESEPEWLRVGGPVLFRGEGRMKCVGRVIGVVPIRPVSGHGMMTMDAASLKPLALTEEQSSAVWSTSPSNF
ncbi:GTP binding protein [Phlyctochytrium planicorne]|nr:GTP binding protein [Phlyctochytrium planicorne]